MSQLELGGAAELRRLLTAHRPSRNPAGYPAEVRARAVSWARPLHEAGHGWSKLSSALGISRNALRGWCAAAPSATTPGPWLPVTVADEPAHGAGEPVLVTPRGFRVENVGTDLLLRILRELG
jgi:hypothetical protein